MGLLHPNRIAWKLIKALILFSSLLTILTTAVQLWIEYGRDMDAIDLHFRQVERGYIESVAENVWEADTGRLDLLVNGITEFPDFKRAEVRDENGNRLALAGDAEGDLLIRNVYPLYYTFRGQRLQIGQLDVSASKTEVYNRALNRVGVILASNFIKTFLVAAFMFALVFALLTRHLDAISKFARTLDFSRDEDLVLERGRYSGAPDEMDDLASSLNEMKGKLFKSYGELHTLSAELEARVHERTQELSNEVEARKQTARQLAESEARLRDIAEASTDWMWETGPDMRFTHLSGGLVAGGIVNPELAIGRHRTDFAADLDDKEKWRKHMDDLENRLPFRDFEYQAKAQGGQVSYVRISGKPIFDEAGEFLGYRGAGTDVTAQVLAEKVAAEARQELRVLSSAIEQSPSAVFITGHDGRIKYVNKKFTSVTGYAPEDVIGKNPDILRAPEDAAAQDVENVWRHVSQGEEWRGEIKDLCKDGSTFWAYVTIAPVKDEAGVITHFIATHEDISERKKAEAQLRDATEHAELANRAKSELMANMSHELRTPLNAIIGFSDTMINKVFGPIDNARYEEYVHDIHDSGAHLLELINDILDVSAIEAGKLELRKEVLGIDSVTQSCLKLVRHRAEESRVNLSHHVEKDMPQLVADERRVKQVLLNLLSNAVKFTPEGGQVTLSVMLAADGGVRFEVEDTGIGMDDKGIETALAQFGQVDSKLARKYEGTGLGLPLSKSLVEAHGGVLEVRSRLGHGTQVTVHFPPERSLSPGKSIDDVDVTSISVGADTDTDTVTATVTDGDAKPTVH